MGIFFLILKCDRLTIVHKIRQVGAFIDKHWLWGVREGSSAVFWLSSDFVFRPQFRDRT